MRAFSLVELSIVLVILGLLVGGVLAAQSMIASAETRKLMVQLDSYSTAVNTFRDKYMSIPGDSTNAASFGFGTNGNGDGLVGGLSTFADGYVAAKRNTSGGVMLDDPISESQHFFVHLSKAGLIADNLLNYTVGTTNTDLDASFPRDALGQAHLLVFSWAGKTYLRTGLSGLGATAARAQSMIGTVSGMQIYGIMTKRSGDATIIDSSTTGSYPAALIAGQKIIPLSVFVGAANGNERYMWNSTTYYNAGGTGYCASGSPPQFNQSNAKLCNVLWQIEGM